MKQTIYSDIKHMAFEKRQEARNQLELERSQGGFKAYIRDLKESDFNFVGSGWHIDEGWITAQVNSSAFNAEELQNHINQHMKALGHGWFKDVPSDDFTSISEYGVPVKVLGGFGPNSAVDPIVLVQSGNGLKLLTILREDGARALPGGMVEGRVKETCINELLEECFSGDLFARDSLSLQALLNTPEVTIENVKEQLLKFVSQNDKLIDLMAVVDQVDSKETGIEGVLVAIKALEHLTGTEKQHECTQLKVELYKTLLPEAYGRFRSIIEANISKGEQLVNISDPRNTDLAWMVTTPMGITLSPEKVDELCSGGFLSFAAGDDASDVRFVDLEIFCNGEAYSDHAALVLDTLANAIYEGKLELNDALKQQLMAINANLQNSISTKQLEKHIDECSQTKHRPMVSSQSVFADKKPRVDEATEESKDLKNDGPAMK